ncbi:MAG: hypothetical protein Q8O72_10680 [Bacteroidales bacterium]|nr:hypothetical protein [Bacteroidales bacterium]
MEKRTLTEIYNAIALEKANMSVLNSWYTDNANPGSVLDDEQTLLEDLTSISKVAIWRLFMFIIAVAIWIHEGLWFVFRSEVDTSIDKHQPHTTRWYQEESKTFQYGDDLAWNAEKHRYEYAVYDKTKRIIQRSAAYEGSGIVAIKVARLLNNELAALDEQQEAAFTAFWQKNKDAGVVINIITSAADLLKLEYEIFFDPLIIAPDGSLISDPAIRPVDDAINNYIANLDFNGRFRLEKCDAYIYDVVGVIDYKRVSAQTKAGLNDYEDINISKVALSGYFIIDPDNTLQDLITYTANV